MAVTVILGNILVDGHAGGCGFVIYGLYYVEVSSLYAYFLEGFLS